MRFSSFSALCGFSVLSLVACTQYPNPMPRGYVSYDQPYKSAPGAQVEAIGYEYSSENNKIVMNDISLIASDLVEKLDKKLVMSIDNIHLKSQADNAFYNSFDYAIREELTKRGYTFAATPLNALTLDFIVVEDIPECVAIEQSEGAYKKLFLALAINVNKGIAQDMVGDYYKTPTYDLKVGDNAGVKLSLCPEEDRILDIAQSMKKHEAKQQEVMQTVIKAEEFPDAMLLKKMHKEEKQKIDISDIIPDLLGSKQTQISEETPE